MLSSEINLIVVAASVDPGPTILQMPSGESLYPAFSVNSAQRA